MEKFQFSLSYSHLKFFNNRHIRTGRCLILLTIVHVPNVRLQVPRVQELLRAVLAVERLVEVIAEGFLAQFLAANFANEITRVAHEELAAVLLQQLLALEDRLAVFAGRLPGQLVRFVLLFFGLRIVIRLHALKHLLDDERLVDYGVVE